MFVENGSLKDRRAVVCKWTDSWRAAACHRMSLGDHLEMVSEHGIARYPFFFKCKKQIRIKGVTASMTIHAQSWAGSAPAACQHTATKYSVRQNGSVIMTERMFIY